VLATTIAPRSAISSGNFFTERQRPNTTTTAIGAKRNRLLPELNHWLNTPRTME
jgi:hypothetical protein